MITDSIQTIHMDTFTPRPYQRDLCVAFESGKYKRFLVVMPRRSGKDIVSFSLMARAALRRVGNYAYLFPNAVQARKAIFEGITSDGKRILDYIPKELVVSINLQQMKIVLINQSTIQFMGSDNYDSLRGVNFVGCVFSEHAYQHPQAYPTIRPVLAANGGWSMFVSTPNGENHFYNLYKIAQMYPEEWYTCFQTIDDTKHISRAEIDAEIASGEISPDMAEQEYSCSFSCGSIGAYYSKYLNQMELNRQIDLVDWEPNYPVHTAWDLGVRDQSCILLFQCIGRRVNIIDMYKNTGVGLEHYINWLQSKPYTYGKHIAPHDIEVREFAGGGLTRLEKAAQLGVKFIIAPRMSVMDGIESVRTTLPRTYIDQGKCASLVVALRNYRKKYNTETKTYESKPLHDEWSDIADALRYLCISLPKLQDTSDPVALERRYNEVRYGTADLNDLWANPFNNNKY